MAEKQVKSQKKVEKYKAVDVAFFKATFNENCPSYEQFCSGEAVAINKDQKMMKYLIDNKFIIKEN